MNLCLREYPQSVPFDWDFGDPSKGIATLSNNVIKFGLSNAMRHIISILLQNESGALSRVATMFASRGFNIEALNVAPTDDASVSRLTLVTIGSEEVVTQISKQLAKLIDVVAIADRTASDAIERELGLLKFAVGAQESAPLSEMIRGAGGRVLDEGPHHFTVEIAGTGKELDTFLASLPEEARLLSVVRSGPLVISRGPKALT